MKSKVRTIILTSNKIDEKELALNTSSIVYIDANEIDVFKTHINMQNRNLFFSQGQIFIATLGLLLTMLGSCSNYNMLQKGVHQDINQGELPQHSTTQNAAYTASTVSFDVLLNASENNTKNSYILKKDDKLSVSIWKHNDLSVGSIFTDYNSNEVYGKWLLINSEGEITLPQVGKVALAGLTMLEAETKLKVIYTELVVDPIIVLKVLNREVTVLGEVTNAGNILLEKDNYTFTEIIGQAGGFKDFANTKEIKLVRNNKTYKMDLTSIDPQTLNSLPILSGDLLYIPAQKSKSVVQKSPAIIPITSAITTLILIITVFK